MRQRARSVLLVEDDETHAMIIIRSFEGADMGRIYWVSDGEEAMDYLTNRGKYAGLEGRPHPDLIMLDLRLPRLDGLEVLKEIKSSRELRTIPVVILTTSKNKDDIKSAYMNHANSYLVKPLGFDKFQQMTKEIGAYWMGWNQGCQNQD